MLQQTTERVFGPFLFFCALSLFAWFTHGVAYSIGWAGLACMAAASVTVKREPFKPGVPLLLAILFIAWLLLDIILFNPVRQYDAFYPPLAFLLGVLTFIGLPRDRLVGYFVALLAFLLILALHGVVQSVFNWGYLGNDTWPRATSVIFVPNNYATLLNIGLLPLVAFYLLHKPHKGTLAAIILLFAALQLSQSRGGQLAFLTGLLFLFFASWRMQLNDRPNWRSLLTGLVTTIVVTELVKAVLKTPGTLERMARAINDGGNRRLDLYELTWHNILADPISGIGYYNFRYFFERDKSDLFTDKVIYYVHNDYLQVWLETGIIGLLLLTGMVFTFYLQVARKPPSSDVGTRITIIAAGAAATAIFAHAAVDYPLYVPLIMLLLGALFAIANNTTPADGSHPVTLLFSRASFRLILAVILLWWPAQHVIAQYYARQATALLLQRELVGAIETITLARRFAPRDEHLAFSAGTLWLNAALSADNHEAAEEADRLFALGTSLNPYEVKSLVQRLKLHRDHPQLLSAPVNTKTMLYWADKILTWQPDNDTYVLEYAKTLVHANMLEEARAYIDEYHQVGLIDTEQHHTWLQQLETLATTNNAKN